MPIKPTAFLNPCYIKISKIRSDVAFFLRSSARHPSSRISPTRSGHHQQNACHICHVWSSRPHGVDWEVINDIATKTVLKLRQSLWKAWKVWSCFVVSLWFLVSSCHLPKLDKHLGSPVSWGETFVEEPAEADIRKRWWLSKRRLIQWNRVQNLVKQNWSQRPRHVMKKTLNDKLTFISFSSYPRLENVCFSELFS